MIYFKFIYRFLYVPLKKLQHETYHSTKSHPMKKKVQAYTLNELLVVLIIIGILILIAIPALMPLITRAKETEAKLQLGHVWTLEKTYYYTYSKYTTDLNALGFEQQKLVTHGGHANYLIQVTKASATGFTATATSVVDFNHNGIFNVWQIDQDKNLKEVKKD